MTEQIKLGAHVKDQITGFEGTVTGRAEYLHSTPSCLVESKVVESNKPAESKWFDESRLTLI